MHPWEEALQLENDGLMISMHFAYWAVITLGAEWFRCTICFNPRHRFRQSALLLPSLFRRWRNKQRLREVKLPAEVARKKPSGV